MRYFALLLLVVSSMATAQNWTLDPQHSLLSFITTKDASISDHHGFSKLTGAVDEDGKAWLRVGLASVESNIDKRNERIREHLFEVAQYPEAIASLSLPAKLFEQLKVGESFTRSMNVRLDLHGQSRVVRAELYVLQLRPDVVEVSSSQPLIINAHEFGMQNGLLKLMELAGLKSIASEVPVTLRLRFVPASQAASH
nr:YceI family protein [uncultured Pseudomonas sp.]